MYVFSLLALMFTQHTAAQKTFVHPGIPFTQYDLDQLKINITQEPWLTGYNALKADSRSKLSYSMQGPFATVTRAPDLNNNAWKSDMIAVHNLTFMYVFTGDAAYAAKATQILDAWAVTNTTWGGGENMLDIGDYAPYFVTGADILKSTYPGWTAANTTHVNNYFANVLYPASWVPYPLRDHNKGAIQLQIALSIAAFLDDETKWNQAIEVYRMDAGGGFRNSLPNGEVGDTGRDDHWFGQIWALSWGAEVAFKQGVDMFAELDNRLLQMGELYNHYRIDPSGLTFIPLGGYSTYYTAFANLSANGLHQHPFNNIIKGAYSLRKNIPNPYTEQMRTMVGEGAWSFLYLKSSDSSTATAMTPIIYPSDNGVPVNYLTNTDIGNPGMIGSVSYNAGTWTAKGSGTAASNANNFTFKPIKGDASIVVKIESSSVSNAVSGLMIRESLASNSNYVSLNLSSTNGITSSASGQTAQTAGAHWQPRAPWWLKLERVGNRVFTFHSHDGINWSNNALYIMTIPADAYIGFYTISNSTTVLNTATFTNVAINNTFPVGSPEINSAVSASTTLGTPFNFNVTANGTPTNFAAAGLPAGLSINASTGVISGTPTAIGKSTVLLTAANANGSAKSSLIIDVISNENPMAISTLAANSLNSTIKLTWSAAANATSYNVKRSLTAGSPYTTIQTGISGTSFIDPNPAYEVNNYYVVTALIGTNESAASNEVFASIPPAVPSNLTAVNQSGQITLNWTLADGASTYKIKRAAISGGPYTEIASVSTNSYTDTALTNGTAYYYVVSSKGTTLESANSIEVFGNPGTNSLTWKNIPVSNVFNLSENWEENTTPASPAILTFKRTDSGSSLTNDISDLTVSRILFDTDASNFTIAGNSIALKSDLVNNSAQAQTLNTPITLNGQLSVNTKSGSIALGGVISGTGGIVKTGTSALIMSGANTYSGNTIVRGASVYAWGSTDGIQIIGNGTGTPSNPLSGPLGKGKIIMEGGALYSSLATTTAATLYNDIEVPAGKSGYFYERSASINLYGKLTGGGTIYNDGSDNFSAINLYGNNSSFTGTFITKLRSGQHRLGFMVPEAGSANAYWLLDAVGVDCHRIMFSSGVLEFGALSGRGGFRQNVAGTPIIRIGALNANTNFGGSFANASGTLSIEKIGTGTQIFSGNSTHTGTTTILNGTFLLNNGSNGSYSSPIVVKNGAFGGSGKSTGTLTVGSSTDTSSQAFLVPGTDGTIAAFTTTNAILNANATYKADISSTGSVSDNLIVTKITLNQPTLILNDIAAGSLPLGTAFTIIDNTGTDPVSGTFKNLPEMSLISIAGHDFRITYKGGTGNDIKLVDDRTQPLVITSPETAITLVGKPYSYTITGIKSPTSFNSTGLPAGLSIDTSTGIISGTPSESGIFPITLTASNASTTATAALKLTVQSNIVGGVIVGSGDAKNIIEWEPVMDLNYNIKRSDTSGGPYTTIGNSTTAQFTDTTITNGNTYYYVVCSVDNNIENPASAQVAALPNIGQISYLKFDEQNGTRLIDSWGAKHGTLTPAATRNTGKYEQGAKFDGTANSYATLPADVVSTLSDFTISSWVKMDALANWMRVFDFGTGTSKYLFLSVQTGSAGSVRYAIKNGGGEQGITYNFAIPLNTWTHFAITQSGNTCSMYINGTLVSTNTGVNIKPSTIGSTNQNYLGKSQWNDPMFNGTIDEFKIYSRALTASEIAEASKLSQTIALSPTSEKELGETDYDPAKASSNLPVNYTSSNTAVASIVEGKIHLLAAGTTTITVSQAGNENYNAAKSVNQELTVNKVYYIDADHDGFGSSTTVLLPVNEAPEGYSTNNLDCDDTKILYTDNDGDGLGARDSAPCGVENNNDCDDTNPIELTSSIPDIFAIDNTQEKNTLYIGYGPSSLSIKAIPAGGTAPYSYAWSNSNTQQTITVSAAGTYTVVITDAKGCQTSASIDINTVNVQCGILNNKVSVCHNNIEICLSPNAVQAHLQHGDKLGSCNNTPICTIFEKVTIHPNPVTTTLNVEVNEVYSGAVLELYNIIGWKVASEPLTNTTQQVSMTGLAKGVYFLHVKNGKHYTIKSILKK